MFSQNCIWSYDLKTNLFRYSNFIDTPSLYSEKKGCVKSKSCNAMELYLMECIFVISHEYSQKTANKRKLWNGQSDFFSHFYYNTYNLIFSQNSLKSYLGSQHLMECICVVSHEYSKKAIKENFWMVNRIFPFFLCWQVLIRLETNNATFSQNSFDLASFYRTWD